MKKPSDLERLLDDVLAVDGPERFTPDPLGFTLQHVRRHRRRRQIASSALIAALLVLITLPLWRPVQKDRQYVGNASSQQSLIHTVTTKAIAAEIKIATRISVTQLVQSSPADLRWVETSTDTAAWQQIDDGQLLTIITGHPATLLHPGSKNAELVFANLDDWAGFRLE